MRNLLKYMTEKNSKLFVFVILICILSAFQIKAETFTILLDETPPYLEEGKGLVVDLLGELFKRTGIEYKIEFVPLSRAVFMVRRDKRSCLLLERSQERETEFKWVGPILIKQFALFSKGDDNLKINVLKDAFHYKIMAVKGSSVSEYLKWFGADVEITGSDYFNALKLKNGRSRLWIADILTSYHYANKIDLNLKKQINVKTTLVPLAFNSETEEIFISELVSALDGMFRDKTVKKIYIKYGNKLAVKNPFYFF